MDDREHTIGGRQVIVEGRTNQLEQYVRSAAFLDLLRPVLNLRLSKTPAPAFRAAFYVMWYLNLVLPEASSAANRCLGVQGFARLRVYALAYLVQNQGIVPDLAAQHAVELLQTLSAGETFAGVEQQLWVDAALANADLILKQFGTLLGIAKTHPQRAPFGVETVWQFFSGALAAQLLSESQIEQLRSAARSVPRTSLVLGLSLDDFKRR